MISFLLILLGTVCGAPAAPPGFIPLSKIHRLPEIREGTSNLEIYLVGYNHGISIAASAVGCARRPLLQRTWETFVRPPPFTQDTYQDNPNYELGRDVTIELAGLAKSSVKYSLVVKLQYLPQVVPYSDWIIGRSDIKQAVPGAII